ncbi:MAG: haloacid dehalogenase-like hydrolase [Actinomycetota bacterium]
MLLLFDIDGTMLQRASREHAVAIHQALADVHGITAPPKVESAGRTDGEIARSILRACGVPDEQTTERADEFRAAACEAYASLCPPDLSSTVAPGISDLLEQLSLREEVTLALVTGNYEPIARLKLARAGIGEYFTECPGGFGSDSEDRDLLPAIARARAGSDRMPFPRDRTVVIGDTPRDIACARADGVRVLAVATGPFGASDLGEADGVAADGAALTPLLLAILDGGHSAA